MKRRIFNTLCAASAVAAAGLLWGCNNQPGSTEKAAPASSAASAVAQGGSAGGRITVGVDDTLPPMVFRDGKSNLAGYDIDLSTEAFKRAGVPFEYRSINWGKKDDFLLKEKSIDVIWAGMNITEERKKLYAISTPYFKNKQLIVVPANSAIQTKNDLGGKTIAVQEGGWVHDSISKFSGSHGGVAKIEQTQEATVALSGLLVGKADAVVGDEVQLRYFVSRSPGKFRILDDNFGETEIGVAVRPGDTELLNKINQALASMQKDGTQAAIYKRWFEAK